MEEACVKRKHSTIEQDSKVPCAAAWYSAIIYQVKIKLLGTKKLTNSVRLKKAMSTLAFPT